MKLDNQIQLRPRFEKVVSKTIETIQTDADLLKQKIKPDFIINRLDEHLWIYIGKEKKKFYSPHLYVEFETLEEGKTKVKVLFGPDPALWTMFMFLHFVIAGIFIIFGVFAYSNWTLKEPYGIHLVVMGLMVAAWFTLYFIARN